MAENVQYIREKLKQLLLLYPEDELSLIIYYLERRIGKKTAKKLLSAPTDEKVNALVESIEYKFNHSSSCSFEYVTEALYFSLANKNLSVQTEKYEDAVRFITSDNGKYQAAYILYKFCKPPYKARLMEFLQSKEFNSIIIDVEDKNINKNQIEESEVNEKVIRYIGFIEKKVYEYDYNNYYYFYNFIPKFIIDNNEVKELEDAKVFFPKFGKINLYDRDEQYRGQNSTAKVFLDSLGIETSGISPIIFVMTLEKNDIEDNIRKGEIYENVQKRVNLTQLTENGKALSNVIQRVGESDVVKIANISKTELSTNEFIDRNIELEGNYYEKELVLLQQGDRYYGPFPVKERKKDGVHFLNLELSNTVNNYLVNYFERSEIIDDLFQINYLVSDTVESQESDTLVLLKGNIHIEDVIPNEVLLGELGRFYDVSKATTDTTRGDALDALTKNSVLFGSNRPSDVTEEQLKEIQQNRRNKAEKELIDLSNLYTEKRNVLKQLIDSSDVDSDSELKSSLSRRMRLSEEWRNREIEFEEKDKQIQELKEQLSKTRSELETKGTYDSKETAQLIESYEQKKKALELEIEEKQKRKQEISEYISENENIKEAGRNLDVLKYMYGQHEKKVSELEKKVSELKDSKRNLEQEINEAIKNFKKNIYAEKANFAFSPLVSQAMFDAAGSLQKEEQQSSFSSSKNTCKTIESSIVKKSKEELILYLTDNIKEFREYGFNDIVNMFICISQNFLTVFAGDPGTGKTSICEILANSLGLNLFKERDSLNRYVPVSVERGWSSKRDLIGYFNPLTKTYDKSNGKIYEGLKTLDAEGTESLFPFLILLDEANLSPIEYYWSEFMRVADQDGRDVFINIGEEQDILIPQTLRFLATINNDQTTVQLSPRLLDRAWVIKLPEIKMDYSETPDSKKYFKDIITWKELSDAFIDNKQESIQLEEVLNNVYQLFDDINLTVSPRVKNSIRKYLLVAQNIMENEDDSKKYEKAIDYVIVQKLLPKINGRISDKKLTELRNICNSNHFYLAEEAVSSLLQQLEENMGFCQFLG